MFNITGVSLCSDDLMYVRVENELSLTREERYIEKKT